MRYLLAALAACSSPAERGPPPPVEPSTLEPPPPPRDPLADVTGDVLDPVPEGDRLWVFEDGIYEERSGTRTSVVGLARGVLDPSDVSEGGEGFLVPDLQRSIAAWTPRAPTFVLGVAPTVPTRTVSRVIYTALQSWDGSHYWLVVRQRDELRAIRVTVPRLAEALLLGSLGNEGALADVLASGAVTDDPSAPREPAPRTPTRSQPSPPPPLQATPETGLHLSLTVTSEGLIVTGSGGKLQAGCRETATGRVITVPARGGAQDWAELRRCLAIVKDTFRTETRVTVSADPNIPFADVANAMVTARGTTTAPLFPGSSTRRASADLASIATCEQSGRR